MSTTTRSARSLATRAAGFAAAVLVVLAGAATAGPGAWWTPLTATGCAGAAGASHAGLVVDFGTVADAGPIPHSTPQATCVSFTSSDETGSDVLVAAGHQLSFDPRSGLLCSIDGYPTSGCGKATGAGYEYWSYWHGGSKWTYATSGPDFTRVASGGVEGWRFVAGQDSSSEHAPRFSAAGPCPPPSPTTTTTRVATPTTASSAGSGGDGQPATRRGPGGAVTSSTNRSSGSSTTAGAGGATKGGAAAAAGTDASNVSRGSTDSTGSAQALAASSTPPHHPGSGSPVGAIAVGALIVAIGAAAFVVSRLRSAP